MQQDRDFFCRNMLMRQLQQFVQDGLQVERMAEFAINVLEDGQFLYPPQAQCTECLCILHANSCIMGQSSDQQFLSRIETLRLAKVDKENSNDVVTNSELEGCRGANVFAFLEVSLTDSDIALQVGVKSSTFPSKDGRFPPQHQVGHIVGSAGGQPFQTRSQQMA